MFSLRSVFSSVSSCLNGINAGSEASGVQKTSILDRFRMNFSTSSSATQSAGNQSLNLLANKIDQDGSKSVNIKTQTRIIRVDDGKTQLDYQKLSREVVKDVLNVNGIRPSNIETEDMMAQPWIADLDLNGEKPGIMASAAQVQRDDKTGKVLRDSNGKEIFGYKFIYSPQVQRDMLSTYGEVKANIAANPGRKAVIDMNKQERLVETIKIAYEKGYISKEVKEQLANMSPVELGAAFGIGGAVGIFAGAEGSGAVLGPAGTIAASLYTIKQVADFEGIVKDFDKATSRAALDKPAREFGAWMGRLSKDGVLAIVGAAGAKIAPAVMPAATTKAEHVITNTAKGVKDVFTEQPPALGQPKLAPANGAPLEETTIQAPKTGKTPLEKIHDPMEARWEHRINIRKGDGSKGSGIEYAWKKHGGGGTFSKSQFTISRQELEAILQRKDIIAQPATKDVLSGNYIREADTGQIIGNVASKKGGQPTSIITIITDEAGNLVNVFPGRLKFQAK